MKRVITLLLVLVLSLTIFVVAAPQAQAASNPYPTWQTVGGVGTVPCTYYAWQQAYDRLGIALPAWGNAINWYYNAPNSGYSVGTTPRANSIAVWSSSSHNYGHVAFVTAVNGSQMTINEGGRTDRTDTNGIVNGRTVPSTVGVTSYGSTLVGFIYLAWNPVNLGNDFYAQITHNASGHGLSQVGYNVELGTANTASSFWHFVRQSDGSYKIYSSTGGLLDVANAETADGTNIAVCARDTGSRAQNWYLMEAAGGYYLYSGLCSKVVDITGASVAMGTNAQLYTLNGTTAQIFTITKGCNHSYTSAVTKKATCITAGVKTYTCSICGDHYTRSYTNANGHKYSAGKCTYCNHKPVGAAVTTQPKAKTVAVGANAKFTVAASGSGLKYQWQYRKSSTGSWQNSSAAGSKTTALTVTTKATNHGYQYRCKITDKYGNVVYTNAAKLTVKPAITTQPKAKTVSVGANAKFTVAASGSGLKYQWQFRKSASGSWQNSSAAGSKTAALTITTKATNHGYQYRCKITDKYGNVVYTDAAKLTVKPAITAQPKSVTVAKGSVAKVTVKAVGNGLTYKWYYKNKGANNFVLSSITGSTYSVAMNSSRNGRQLYCVVKDRYGNTVGSDVVVIKMK